MLASPNAAGAGQHTPVLYQQVLSALRPSAGSRYIDGTLGAGGHAFGVLEASSPDGSLLGIDRDSEALKQAVSRLIVFGDRALLRQGSFAAMRSLAEAEGWTNVHGVLLDLGLSSMQLADPSRGFSFQHDGPLDMRFDRSQPFSAADLVNHASERDLIDVLARFGEEPRARRIARAIVAARPLTSTTELANVVAGSLGGRRSRIHPATRTFQALRIAVNDELTTLETGLEQAVDLLGPGSRVVVIAFHSLEDRIVKAFFRAESRDCVCPPEQLKCTCEHRARLKTITPRPIRPTEEEVAANPRSRSARMRVAERLELA
jgi:16S rRNA (cytosine1402-N4)-methyltransferase